MKSIDYHCCFGPEDDRLNEPPLHREEGKRISASQKGMGMRRGCKAAFSVVLSTVNPELVEVRYSLEGPPPGVQGHSNHGPDCFEAGRYRTNARLSEEIRYKTACGIVALNRFK